MQESTIRSTDIMAAIETFLLCSSPSLAKSTASPWPSLNTTAKLMIDKPNLRIEVEALTGEVLER